MKNNVWVLVLGILVASIVLFKTTMWLIVDYNLSPVYLSVIIVYVAMVYPQLTTLHGLKIVNALQDEEYDGSLPKSNKRNWILFINDIDLVNYFGSENIFKMIVGWMFKLSIPVLVFSLFYLNFLIVFMDLGVGATVFIKYALLISIAVYIITKGIILGYFIQMFKGFTFAVTGLVYPIGFMVLNWSLKAYLSSLEDVIQEETMGLSYR